MANAKAARHYALHAQSPLPIAPPVFPTQPIPISTITAAFQFVLMATMQTTLLTAALSVSLLASFATPQALAPA